MPNTLVTAEGETMERVTVDRVPGTPWEALVERYKGDRRLCNCRQAYYYTAEDGHQACRYGCQANQHAVREEIARAVVGELRAAGNDIPVHEWTPTPYPGPSGAGAAR